MAWEVNRAYVDPATEVPTISTGVEFLVRCAAMYPQNAWARLIVFSNNKSGDIPKTLKCCKLA
jgi:hypothetical protein